MAQIQSTQYHVIKESLEKRRVNRKNILEVMKKFPNLMKTWKFNKFPTDTRNSTTPKHKTHKENYKNRKHMEIISTKFRTVVNSGDEAENVIRVETNGLQLYLRHLFS